MNNSPDRRYRAGTAEALAAPAEGQRPDGRTSTWSAPGAAIVVWMAADRSGQASMPTSVVATSCKADLFRSRCTGQRS